MGQLTKYDFDLVNSRVPWSKYFGKKVLVTGGTGFIGKWLQFPHSGKFTFLDSSTYYIHDWEKKNWDYIFHLANVSPDRVIQCAKRCGAKVLYASSGAVLDCNPREYAQNKILWEEMIHESGINYVIARMYTFAGAFMPNKYALINFIRDAIDGGPIKVRGDPKTVRTYMYAADMVVWLHGVMLNGKSGETYSVGTDYPMVSMKELAYIVSGYFHDMDVVEKREIPVEDRPLYIPPNIAKTMIDCKVKCYTPFATAIQKTIEAYR